MADYEQARGREVVMKYYSIQVGAGVRCLVTQDHAIAMVCNDLLTLEPGDGMKVAVIDMSEEEYSKLQEFQGW